jgi:predicted PurR-regulated permease PerM
MIAYTVLPVVNVLDRFMPRLAAAALLSGAIALTIVGLSVIVLRPFVVELFRAYRQVPSPETVHDFIGDVNRRIETWPAPVQEFVRVQVQNTLMNARGRLQAYIAGLDTVVVDAMLGVINAIGILLGLLVLPVWILLVMKDQNKAAAAINRQLPNWLEADFWAVVRIVDRVLGAYLRGLAVFGVLIGAGIFTGFRIMHGTGFEVTRYPVALAAFAAVMELVPTIGPIVAGGVIVLASLRQEAGAPLLALALYIGIRWVARRLVTQRVENRVIDMHPAILVVVLVALTQFGLVWALLAAPVAAIARDLFRYIYGRFSDPPRPAGVLPGEPIPALASSTAMGSGPSPRKVPLVYQRTDTLSVNEQEVRDNAE